MKTIIVADDLTGANVSNSLLAKNGLRVGSLDGLDDISVYSEFDAIGFHTDSRGISKEDAYKAVYDITSKASGMDVKFFNKRIDSTLRGNVGAEIDGMMDALPNDIISMLVPGFPNSGKIVIGNYMLVNGTPLENTDVRNDPTSPVLTSRVAAIVRQQSKKPVGVITMETILEGVNAIELNIKVLVNNGVKIIIFDSCTNEDIVKIAKAVLATDLPFISVDPGPFTNALVKELTPVETTKSKQKALFIIGTVSGIITDQMADFKATYAPYTVKINSEDFLYADRAKNEIERVTNDILSNIEDHHLFVIATMNEKSDKIDLDAASKTAHLSVHDASEKICASVAEIGYQIVQRSNNQIGGVYTSGGDITKSFLKRCQANGIEIKDEIIPLAVYGRVIGGIIDNTPIVTKGGLIGDKKTLSKCAAYLTTKISNSFYKGE
ncbi:four-carbon acid sugar kinase family protein [Sporolactobacillus terrae]|uniref:four-carbon acid sugar kinase family protein n=1 Tax=Sporolactobacillus terrae TaxID=269673 RepID=UPI00056B008A|nr:four-carbon acid sugar kinase family protein [Sporolactobacillus terrae]